MINILDKLPGLETVPTTEVEEDPAQAKKDRIAFHRTSVRNGPANFKTVTTGQRRRAMVRATQSMQRKGYRSQVKAYFAAQREAASLRHRLQAVGLLPYRAEVNLPQYRVFRASVDLIQAFAEAQPGEQVEVTEAVVRQAFETALNRYLKLVGQQPTTLPEEYDLPVGLAAG